MSQFEAGTSNGSNSSLQPLQRHLSAGSIDTNASAIADSAISFAGSLHLSQFPAPPPLPSTPTQSEFSPPSPGSSRTHRPLPDTRPLVPLHSHHINRSSPPPLPSVESYTASQSSRREGRVQGHDVSNSQSSSSAYGRAFSPYDWHEGASSIDVDAAEDRLLSTSFITSLLQESSETSKSSRRASVVSDALSGFSEMTYPPVVRYPGISDRPPPIPTLYPPRQSTLRPQGARPPPSAFQPIMEPSGHVSDDSMTLASNEFDTTIIRSASISRGPNPVGTAVVGIAPARLHSVSASSAALRSQRGSEYTGMEGNKASSSYAQYADLRSTFGYSPALPSTAVESHFLRDNPRSTAVQSRQSLHSTKSLAPSVLSRISSAGRSIARALPWKKTKPLPPVPVIPDIPLSTEMRHREDDASAPLPDLVARADVLNGMLEKGYHPHQSLASPYYGALPKSLTSTSGLESDSRESQSVVQRRARAPWPINFPWDSPDSPKKRQAFVNPKRKRYYIILAAFIVIAGAAVGAGVGVSLRHSSSSTSSCSGVNVTGSSCDLDASCVCKSNTVGQCNRLAQSLINLIPAMNQQFNTIYSPASVYTSLWLANGSPTGTNCASQAVLIDTPGLASSSFPNRTQWARSALLWNLVQSQNVSATNALQSFIENAPWSKISSSDGPVDDDSTSFATTVSGFTFDFASQSVTQPVVGFIENGQPLNDQISRVGNTAKTALDRMYSYAFASSTQREAALSTYWTSVLQQKSSDLPAFRSAIISSSIILPFDGTFSSQSQALADLMTTSTTQPFPPPLSCYPGLNSTQMQQINDIEQVVFDLSPVSAASKFDISCYPDRPIYGVLDVLRLRLPFLDSRPGVATQGAVLIRNAGPRAIIRSGELLSALPASSNSSSFVNSATNPRDFGTLNNLNHVLLNYLSSIPDPNVATALIQYVLSSTTLPPVNTSILAESIATIPSLEVSIFGSVLPEDVSFAISSFTSSPGSLFFGSNEGQALRTWAITATGSYVTWAQSALSTSIARDTSLSDTTFNATWQAAALAIQNNVSSVTVSNITNSLQSTGKLSS